MLVSVLNLQTGREKEKCGQDLQGSGSNVDQRGWMAGMKLGVRPTDSVNCPAECEISQGLLEVRELSSWATLPARPPTPLDAAHTPHHVHRAGSSRTPALTALSR
ncbi:hypothetical protein DPEC_G00245800 [Dallia pectoralis]|uniref:Uncharacterized protein n=1 Tax=Dallia pectoralis TaxID=75939 RepID=A0ACC2FVW9_DALPE|nr:hypothetical protein DPEC_G00245800 [Dallia pectoralis]